MHPTREDHKFDPVTALDRRSGPRDRRKSDRGDGDRRRSSRGGHMFQRKSFKIGALLFVALVCSVGITTLLNSWFESELSRYKSTLNKKAAPVALPKTKKVLVTTKRLTYGMVVAGNDLKLIDWPADAVPDGVFSKKADLLKDKGERRALMTMEPNEPILVSKITGAGQKASLSALLETGKKAVTVRVDDVLGVAGLILPNDKVDVLWTIGKRDLPDGKEPYTEILVSDVRVLAIDQNVQQDEEKTFIAKAVTIEVDLQQAQKIALGTQTGKLHLTLRGTASDTAEHKARVSLSNLGFLPNLATDKKSNKSGAAVVVVTRGVESKNYNVVRETRVR